MRKSTLLAFALILVVAGCSSNSDNRQAKQTSYESTVPLYESDSNCVVAMPEETPNNVPEYEDASVPLHFTATEIVAPIFDSVRAFRNGYAVVGMGQVWNDEEWSWERGLYGLIDREGNLVLPIIYDRIGDIRDTEIVDNCVFVIVTYDGKSGILSVHGDEILPIIYTRVSIHDNLASVSYGTGSSRTAGLFNLLTGEFVIPKGEYVAIGTFINENRAWVTLGPANGWRWGLVDTNNGELLTPMVYTGHGTTSSPNSFRNGMALAFRDIGSGRRAGFLDVNGSEITEFIYDDASGPWNGIAEVNYNGRWGLVDTEGAYVIEPIFDSMRHLQQYVWHADFRYFPVSHNGVQGIWDMAEGRLTVPHMNGVIADIYSNFAIIRYGNWSVAGILNIETDEYVIPLGYMHFGNNTLRNGLTPASKGSRGSDYRMGIVDIRTGEIVADFIYDDLSWQQGVERDYLIFRTGAEWERNSWDGDYFYALADGFFGVMDSCGNIIIPAIYSFIRYMHGSSDLFAVTLSCKQNGTKMGVINSSGEIVLPIVYTHVGHFFHPLGFRTSFAPINIGAEWVWDNSVESYWGDGGYELIGGKWGFIDTNGNLVIPVELEYDIVLPVVEGMAAVRRDGKWGFIAVW